MANDRVKRRIPEINSSSAADVSFLLLLFFILTSSIGLEKVMPIRLSPPAPEHVPMEHIQVKERNFLPLYIDENDQILFRSETIAPGQLRTMAKEFIANPSNKDNLPEKEEKDINLIGTIEVSDAHIISLSGHDKAHFQTYVFAQNELLAAYNELRNELAMKVFSVHYNQLNEEQQHAVNQCYPRRISKPEKISEGGANE